MKLPIDKCVQTYSRRIPVQNGRTYLMVSYKQLGAEMREALLTLTHQNQMLEQRCAMVEERVATLTQDKETLKSILESQRDFYHDEMKKTLEFARESSTPASAFRQLAEEAQEVTAEQDAEAFKKAAQETQEFWNDWREIDESPGIFIKDPNTNEMREVKNADE